MGRAEHKLVQKNQKLRKKFWTRNTKLLWAYVSWTKTYQISFFTDQIWRIIRFLIPALDQKENKSYNAKAPVATSNHNPTKPQPSKCRQLTNIEKLENFQIHLILDPCCRKPKVTNITLIFFFLKKKKNEDDLMQELKI